MSAEYTYYLIAVVIAGVGLAGIALYAWRQRQAPGGRGFAAMMASTSVYTLAIATALLCQRPESALTWLYVRKISSFFVPLGWLYFALEFGQFRTRYISWLLACAWLIPVVSTLLALTNESHQLFWIMLPFSQLSWPYLFTENVTNPLYSINEIYPMLIYLPTLIALTLKALRTPGIYRRQVPLIILAMLMPGLFYIFPAMFWIFQVEHVPGDPFSFLAMGIILTWGLFRLRIFDLKPVAHKTVIKTMSDGVLVLDDQGRIIEVNPAMQPILEHPEFDDIIGQPILTVLPAWESVGKSLLTNTPTETDLTLSHPEQPRTYNLRLSPLFDRRKKISGRLVVFRDITTIKQAEAALRNYAADLEASNAELDAFAHTVAHDLKSPLTIIVGFGALLDERLERLSSDIVHDNLQRIVRTGKKMVNIINELLLLSGLRKIEDLATGPVPMDEIIAEVQARVEAELSAAEGELLTPATWPAAIGYGPWVEEVWVNYVNNAIKYGGRPEHGIPPHVKLGWDLKESTGDEQQAESTLDSAFVRFWVRDNGHGLTDEQCAQLFTQFTRLHKARAEGHGLGLSIVQRIVTKLGGEVGVESVVGEGSTFWFTLPKASPNMYGSIR